MRINTFGNSILNKQTKNSNPNVPNKIISPHTVIVPKNFNHPQKGFQFIALHSSVYLSVFHEDFNMLNFFRF